MLRDPGAGDCQPLDFDTATLGLRLT
ncbi:uncharacterized protein METZ01_LOCUS431937 [marine metagenome]|uniref:Uncharacterized protein n=1 Tax=marine metagenome TaxID=408172 RepID=A0A382Y759_9ZZZZ